VPTVPFALKAGDVATPRESVVPVAVLLEPKVPPAPAPGAENVTVAPTTGVPAVPSVPVVTVTESFDANELLITVFCWDGLLAATVVTAAGVTVAGFELHPVRNAMARIIGATAPR
jgi:hypothetical protein